LFVKQKIATIDIFDRLTGAFIFCQAQINACTTPQGGAASGLALVRCGVDA